MPESINAKLSNEQSSCSLLIFRLTDLSFVAEIFSLWADLEVEVKAALHAAGMVAEDWGMCISICKQVLSETMPLNGFFRLENLVKARRCSIVFVYPLKEGTHNWLLSIF